MTDTEQTSLNTSSSIYGNESIININCFSENFFKKQEQMDVHFNFYYFYRPCFFWRSILPLLFE